MSNVDMPSGGSDRVKPQWKSLLFFTTKRHLIPTALATGCSLVSGLIVPLLAALLGAIFNDFARYGSHAISNTELLENVSKWCLYLCALGAAIGVWHTTQFALWVACGELQAKVARETVFDALLRADLQWFETVEDGVAALLPRIQSHVHNLQLATSQPMGFTVENVTAATASLIFALTISWKLALVCISTVPICAIVVGIASKKIQPYMELQQRELTKASKLASCAISSIETVKVFNGQESELARYSATIHDAARWYLPQALACAIEVGCIHLLTFGMFVQGFWYGGYLVSRGELNAGQVLTTFWACFQATQSIEDIIPQLLVLERGRSSASFLKATILDIRDSFYLPCRVTKRTPLHCEGDIRFKNVIFSYPSRPDSRVLDDCSFFFPAGDITFVVGRSGSGKSTIGNLLTGLYPPSSGQITIDGVPIGALDIHWVRNNVTLVQQQTILFNESILKNIAFGSREPESIRENDLLASLQFAGLLETIHNLPLGLNTVVGTHGNLLSGGQRQRVALARARLRDTPILILDESTSALDQASRTAVMTALRLWRKGKTTIVITHDPNQIQENDFVYVVDKGLVRRKGYRQVVEHDAKEIFQPATPLHRPCPIESRASISRVPEGRNYRTSTASPLTPLLYQRLSFHQASSPAFRPNLQTVSPRFSHTGSLQPPYPPEGEPSPAGFERRSPHDAEEKQAHGVTVAQQAGGRPISLNAIAGDVISSLSTRNRVILSIGFLCAVCHAAATPVFSYSFSHLLTTFFLDTDASAAALRWALVIVGVSVANALSTFGMHYLLERCGQAWVDRRRSEAMRSVLHQPRHWFGQERNTLSSLVDCLDRNAEEMKNLVGKFAGFVIVATVMVIMGVGWGASVCWKLALVGTGCGPVLYALTRLFESVNQEWENRSRQTQQVLAGIFTETFLDIRTVRALTLESYFDRKHYKANWQSLTTGLKGACCTAVLYGLSNAAIVFVYGLVFYYGAVLTSSLEYSTPDILTVLSLLLFCMVNVKAVLALIPQISASRDNATRVFELARLPNHISHEHRRGIKTANLLPIEFRNATFSYPSRPGRFVLHNLDLSIEENTCTAIVGASGSGKSTIASVLLGLYPMNSNPLFECGFSGSITLRGLDLSKIHIPTLRSLIAVVSQHPTLFSSTIRANISYGLDEHSPLNTAAAIINSARAAGIHDFITSLPLAYDTVVGDGGLGLSGGQAQRIAVARALIRQPQVLILDEATSNLDRESTEVIRKTVKDLMLTKMTIIIITHAMEMMEIADRVVVIDRGKVVDQGSFAELMHGGAGAILGHLATRPPTEQRVNVPAAT